MEWTQNNWNDATGIPIGPDRFGQIMLPGAGAGRTEIDKVEMSVSAVVTGARYTWRSGVWVQDTDANGDAIPFSQTIGRLVTDDWDYPYNLNITDATDLSWAYNGGIAEFVRGLQRVFRGLKSKLDGFDAKAAIESHLAPMAQAISWPNDPESP